MANKVNPKRKLARRLITQKEISAKVRLYDSKAWMARKAAIERRVANKVEKTKARKAAR